LANKKGIIMALQFRDKQYIADPLFSEKNDRIADDNGFELNLKEISLRHAGIRWGRYINPSERLMTFEPENERIVSHFQMLGSDLSTDKKGLRERQFVIYRESAHPYVLSMAPTHQSAHSFFELIMNNDFFDNLISEESAFLVNFDRHRQLNTFSPEFIAQVTPQMYSIITDMQNAPYTGSLKGLFLETKLMELFLMQIYQLDNKMLASTKLNPGDIERLHYIKLYIGQHFSESLSIISLSKEAGFNQSKLKSGFKELFKTTVFEYVNDCKLKEAKRLLLEEKRYVTEVAYMVGYKYPHYFSAAFKKKFGILPTNLKW
jgi:AraC-like DNA-binding protein